MREENAPTDPFPSHPPSTHRCLANESNYAAASASCESVLPLRFLVGAPARERMAQVEAAARPCMTAACEKPVLSHSLMG